MNKRLAEVQQTQLDPEAKTLRQLKQVYNHASKDCAECIAALSARTDMENLQSIIYQQQYQEALKAQIDGILDDMNSNSFTTITEYLTKSYENGYVGVMYDPGGIVQRNCEWCILE